MRPVANRSVTVQQLLLLFSLVLVSQTTSATSCFPDPVGLTPEKSRAYAESKSSVIFVGTVKFTSITVLDDGATRFVTEELAHVSIESVEKGNLPVGEMILVRGSSFGCLCSREFESGKRYRILAAPDKGKVVATVFCDQIEEIPVG